MMLMGGFYNMGGYQNNLWGPSLGPVGGAFFGLFFLLLAAWTLYWKYHALWYAAKHDHKWWFIALLVINTVGILEILYLYVFAKRMDLPAGGLPHDESKTPMIPPQQ